MMMRVRVLPSSSRLVKTVCPRASMTVTFFFGAAPAGSGQQGRCGDNCKRDDNDFQTHGFLADRPVVATQCSGLRFAATGQITDNCCRQNH